MIFSLLVKYDLPQRYDVCGEIWKENKNDDLNIFTHQNIITRERREWEIIIIILKAEHHLHKNKKIPKVCMRDKCILVLRFSSTYILCVDIYVRGEREENDQCNVFWWMMSQSLTYGHNALRILIVNFT